MGSSWSSHAPEGSPLSGDASISKPVDQSKRRRRLSSSISHDPFEQDPQLIPGLPDELSLQVLARVPRWWQSELKSVCMSWNRVLGSGEVFDLRKEMKITEEWLYVLIKDEQEQLGWYALDPVVGRWRRLPPMPDVAQEEEEDQEVSTGWSVIFGIFKGLFRRKDSMERSPFCGCSAAGMNGELYVLGGFFKASAMRCVWRYNPKSNRWSAVAGMGTPRAYCKTGLLNNRLYAVGGVSRGRGGLTPLQSAEVYDPENDTWNSIPNMPFMRAQVLPTAFLADMLKPIATGMAAFKGQLWVPQSLYSWPFFVDVGGEVYDPVSNIWSDMPRGMGEGWPARQAGTKLSVIVNGHLFSLDPTGSLDGSKIKVYDFEHDAWRVAIKKVPILLDLTDSESPYLLCCLNGALHLITKDVNDKVIVMRAELNECSTSQKASSSDSDSDYWKTIGSKNFGPVELVTCQVLDI